MTRRLAGLATLALLAACGAKAPPPAAETPPVQVPADNIWVVDTALLESGPALSGSLAAEHEAQLRAQIGGAVIATFVEEGAVVANDAPLVLIDTLTWGEQARSARSQQRSADAASQLAHRNYERQQALYKAGAIAERDLEAANNAMLAADANLADARSRLASAEKALANAMVRAPWGGIVSDRAVNTGDVVQPGALLVTVVDPSSLKLEADVAADQAGSIKRGAKVEFSVTGYPGKRVSGTIARINPAVDPMTRQIRVYAQIPNGERAIAAGTFAEGRVTTSTARALSIPLSALDTRAAVPSVKRVSGGKVESVPVTLGLRDEVAERVAVTAGLARGDTVLTGGVLGTPVGSQLRITRGDH